MATSLYDEIQTFLVHSLEQTPLAHEVMTKGRIHGTAEESIGLLVAITSAEGQALLRIARRVDELQATIEGR